jgi:protein kinase-like protein/PEGA domain-containing protein
MRELSSLEGSSPLHIEAAGTAPPEAFGPFRVLHQIGAGTLGPVFRAYDPQRERLVAVKLFKIDLSPDTAHRLVANLERVVAAAVAHPAIVAPTSAGLTDISAFLVSEFVTGESLDLVLRQRGPLTPTEALRMATALAAALDAAADAGIKHGSLHPRDVLLAGEGVRLTGLGVAQSLDQAGVPSPVRRPYAAPERMSGGSWEPRADVFALAAVVYEMMSGKRIPGVGNQVMEGLNNIAGADMDALGRAFSEALAGQPERRTATAGKFVEALRTACGDLEAVPSLPAANRAPRKDPLASADAPAVSDARLSAFPSEGSLPLHDDEPGKGRAKEPRVERAREAAEAQRPERVQPLADEPRIERMQPVVEAGRSEPVRIPAAEPRFASLREPAEEPSRFVDVQIPSAAVELPQEIDLRRAIDIEPVPPVVPMRASAIEDSKGVPIELTMLERSRSAVWPLVLALLVGVALGFAAGYSVRDNPVLRQSIGAVTSPPSREFTENAVPEAPKPAAPSQVSATPPEAGPVPEAAAPAAPAPPQQAGIGRLVIRSSPAGARVFVDGQEAGRTTTTVPDLTAGPHQLRLERDGYTAVERQFMITRTRPTLSMTVSLERARPAALPTTSQRATPAATTGRGAPATAPPRETPDSPLRSRTATLTVDSRPTGARVYVDDRLIGTTPLSMPEMIVGDHVLRMEHDGYRRWVSSIRVVAGEQNRVTASLER